MYNYSYLLLNLYELYLNKTKNTNKTKIIGTKNYKDFEIFILLLCVIDNVDIIFK